MTASFEELGLSQDLLDAVKDMGFEEPSPIQVLAVPALLAGRDAVGQAQTAPARQRLSVCPFWKKSFPERAFRPWCFAPRASWLFRCRGTEQLAARKKGVTILPVYGGQLIERQFRALAKGAQVVVGTPGRIIDHLQRGHAAPGRSGRRGFGRGR